MNPTYRLRLLLLLCGLPLSACMPDQDAGTPAGQANQHWQICATCHGATGGGDGPASAPLDPKPRTFRDRAWQASVTDEHIAKVMVEGGAAVGKSPLMPPHPQLKGKPEVVQELVARIRRFAQ